MAYSYRNSIAAAWGTSHGRRAPAFNTSSELQSHLAGVNWADVSDSRANPRPYNELSLDTNLLPIGSGYHNVPTNLDPFQGTTLQSQQSIDDIARQLRTEQSIDVFSERAPWFPGSRVSPDRSKLPQPQEDYTHLSPERQHGPEAVAATPTLHKSPRSSTLSAYTRTTSRSGHNKSPASLSSEKIIKCGQCGRTFSGRFQRGNRARHARQQHFGFRSINKPECICRVCYQVFKRQDARRKHEWRQHALPDAKPCPRGHTDTQKSLHVGTDPQSEESSTPITMPDDSQSYAGMESSYTGTCDLQSSEDTTPSPSVYQLQTLFEYTPSQTQYKLPSRPEFAAALFSTIKESLDATNYDSFCNIFLNSWNGLVAALRTDHTNLHDVFAGIIVDLAVQLQPEPTDTEPGTRPSHGKDTASKPLSQAMPSLALQQHRYGLLGGQSTTSDGVPQVAYSKSPMNLNGLKLDCPIHKWHVLNRRTSPCGGCGKESMSQVRHHLKPSSSSNKHKDHISFIRRCERCKDDIVDEVVWRNGHVNGTCPQRTQPRRSDIWRWARLFLTLYPQSTRIPSPHTHDNTTLPDHVVEEVRNDLGLPPLQANPEDEANRVAALATVLNQSQVQLANTGASAIIAAGQFRLAPEEVATEYRRRLVELHRNYYNEVTHNDPWVGGNRSVAPPPNNYQVQGPMGGQVDNFNIPSHFEIDQDYQPMLLDPPQVPITGGAGDFDVPPPHYPPHLVVHSTQLTGSDVGTHSTQDYYTNSGPSFFGSSQTSQDFGKFMIPNHMQTPARPLPVTPGNQASSYFPEYQQSPMFYGTYPAQTPLHQQGDMQMQGGLGYAQEQPFYSPLDFSTSPELDDRYNAAAYQELSDID